MILRSTAVDPAALARRTGWKIRPEGACKGDVCVPLPPDAVDERGLLDVTALADRAGMPLLHDEVHGLWALGPETAISGRALTTADAPDLELPDVRTGAPFSLGSLRGQKVLLVAWASW